MPVGTSSEQNPDDSEPEFVEIDPTGRYGRYKEVLGKGAFKKVYRAFDQLEGIEVAWNQVKVAELLRNAEDLERLYSEVHLLKTLKHKNIIKFYNSWVDTKNEHINFITEIFTSGTLRQYRMKHKHVDLRALKKWSRQILEGLLYLHSHDPPVIHRDLKCDNVFVNGNSGEVKIGDLGLAAILHHANAAHSVIGTPEFMAPELYEEEYNELVDIYAFGMCMLELVNLEYPYAECCNAAQIYKKVTLGIKPASLAKVADPAVRVFIGKCIAKVSERLSATQLLRDPFLSDAAYDNIGSSLHVNVHTSEVTKQSDRKFEDSRPGPSRDVIVQGERKDVNTIFVKLRISDSKGNVRNIHFPFDIEADTSIAVASEMVHELDLTDQDVTAIADTIDSEIRNLIPDWSPRESSISDSLLSDNKYEASPHNFSENNKDDISPMTNASSGLFYPDRFPSGRKFWSDSPRAGVSPLKSAPMSPITELHSGNTEERSFQNTPKFRANSEYREECENEKKKDTKPELIQNTESGDLGTVVEKLEHVLDQQQKELDELKGKHELVISDILKELSPEVRLNLFNMCSKKIPDYKMQSEMNLSSQISSHEGSQATKPQRGSRRERFKSQLSNVDVKNGVYHYPGASVDRIFAHTKTMIDVAISPRFFHLLSPLEKPGVAGVDRPSYKDKLNGFMNGSQSDMNGSKKESESEMGIAVVLRDSSENNS